MPILPLVVKILIRAPDLVLALTLLVPSASEVGGKGLASSLVDSVKHLHGLALLLGAVALLCLPEARSIDGCLLAGGLGGLRCSHASLLARLVLALVGLLLLARGLSQDYGNGLSDLAHGLIGGDADINESTAARAHSSVLVVASPVVPLGLLVGQVDGSLELEHASVSAEARALYVVAEVFRSDESSNLHIVIIGHVKVIVRCSITT